jgi:hypothetical protein
MTWTLVSNTQISVSPLSGSVQTQELPGARWRVSIAYPPLLDADAALLRSFLVRMRGQANRVDLYPWDRQTPRGTALGTPLVKGASQTGATLVTDGWNVGATLLAGDFIQFGTQLCVVATNPSAADGAGNMTIPIEPPIRTSPADNGAITISQPKARFMLAGAEVGWSVQQYGVADFAFELVEAFA